MVAVLTLLVATAAASAGTTNLVANGGFEDTHGVTVGSWVALKPDSTTISPWVVGGAGTAAVDAVGTLWQQLPGSNNSLDLNGNNIGWAQQTIPTVAGELYTLTFNLSGNPGANGMYAEAGKTLTVFATTPDGGGSQASFVFNTENSFGDMKWESRSWTFEAPINGTLLKFLSTSGTTNGAGPVIDNVSVSSAVPVPGALLLAGLGTAVVGWMRGRKLS
jgi:hypothetical protein